MVMTQEEKRQLMVKSLKEKMISNLKRITSDNNSIENILFNISDEAEQNLLKILNYLKEKFEYQCRYFELNNTIFVPNIYRVKNDTFYIFKFINQYRDKQLIIEQFQQQYPHIKLKQLSLKQYRRILKWFRDDLLFTVDKYKINFSKDNRRRIKCECCGKKFFTQNNNIRYCSNECARNRQNKIQKASKVKHYRDGYYMDIHHYVRSGWEHNIARILQWLQLDYDFECHTFTLSNGLAYTPDFYVYADDTYYEVKGEMRTNTLAKYNMFKEEYPDKHFVIIDGTVYTDLLKQFLNINFDLHVPVVKSYLNNVIEYRHDQINYEPWELNYEFYTNRRYTFNNIELTSTEIVNDNDLLYSCSADTIDTVPDTKLLTKFQAMQLLNLTSARLNNLVSTGLINYYLIDEQIYFTKAFISEFQQFAVVDKRLQITTLQNQLQIKHKLSNDKTEIIIDNTINEVERNIMYILRFLNVDFTYEAEALEYSLNKFMISKIYVPQEDNYYFVMPAYTQNYRNQVNELKTWNKTNINIVTIDQNTYDLLIVMFSKKIPHIVVPEHISTAINNRNNAIETVGNSSYHRCLACGKILANKRKKYCSMQCWAQARHKYVQQRCLNCGNEFQILKSDQTYIYFCSEQCRIDYKQAHLTDNTIVTNTCKYCKKEFTYFNKNKKHEFCSHTCANNYQLDKHKKTYICKECGKEFTSAVKRIFCSTSCNAKWNYRNNRSINITTETTKIFPTSAYYMDIHHFVKNYQEHNIARILQINQLNYEYLPKQFLLTTGESLMPSFFVIADNMYYVVANTVSIEKLTKQIELVASEYNVNNICLIDKQTYTDLIKQYLPKSLAENHVATNKENLNNITVYDSNAIYYEPWELDYKFYTYRRYINDDGDADERLENYVYINDKSINLDKIRFMYINNMLYLFKTDLETLKYQSQSQLSSQTRVFKYTQTCAVCGKTFKTNIPHQKYCSSACFTAAKNKRCSKYKRSFKITCSNCGKTYISTSHSQKICRDCYYQLCNTPEIKRRQANEMLIRNLSYIKWNLNDEHQYFENEVKNNFALILEYLGNSYIYDDNYCYIDNNQFVYRYSFVRLKNNTMYFFQFAETSTIIQRFKSFCNENPNIKIHVIDRKKYERILAWFKNRLNFKTDKYPLRYYLEHVCLQCKQRFFGNFQKQFCSTKCKLLYRKNKSSLQ